MARSGFVYHPDYLEHDMGHTHPESPQRLRAIVGRLEETGLLPSLVRIDPKPATDDWITQVHEHTYVKGLRQRAPQKGYVSLDPDTRSEEHTSELQSPCNLVCRLLLEKKKDSRSC